MNSKVVIIGFVCRVRVEGKWLNTNKRVIRDTRKILPG
jgi:hypothetical protein